MLKQHSPMSTYRGRISLETTTEAPLSASIRFGVAIVVASAGLAFSGFSLALWLYDKALSAGLLSL